MKSNFKKCINCSNRIDVDLFLSSLRKKVALYTESTRFFLKGRVDSKEFFRFRDTIALSILSYLVSVFGAVSDDSVILYLNNDGHFEIISE